MELSHTRVCFSSIRRHVRFIEQLRDLFSKSTIKVPLYNETPMTVSKVVRITSTNYQYEVWITCWTGSK